MIQILAKIIKPLLKILDWLTPVADIAARLWVASIFFMAGIVKVKAWQSTLMLFNYQYHVPFLSPTVAAYLGTGAEIILPILLVLGLGGRITIALLFVYNIVAVVSYPFLLTAEGWNGLTQHINWGLLLFLLMTHGSGKLSLDCLIRRRHGHHLN